MNSDIQEPAVKAAEPIDRRPVPAPNGAPRPGKQAGNKKVANGLVALISADVLAVYAAGYRRTAPAAEALDSAWGRRPTT